MFLNIHGALSRRFSSVILKSDNEIHDDFCEYFIDPINREKNCLMFMESVLHI